MKVLLFEGIDKVGKTTIIKTLDKSLKEKGYKAMILNVPFSCNNALNVEQSAFRLRMTLDNLLNMNKQFGDDYVCLIDRLHISERVYGEVLRDGCFDNFQCNSCDYWISTIDTTLIHVKPVNVLHNFMKFKDENNLIDGLTYSQYLGTYQAFIREVQKSLIHKKIDLTTVELNEIEKFLGGI